MATAAYRCLITQVWLIDTFPFRNLATLDGKTICTSNPNGGNYSLPAGSSSPVVTGPTTAA